MNSIDFTDFTFEFPRKTHKWCVKPSPMVRALDGISGVFTSGKLTAICAPSGGGKTTLLNALAGRASKTSVQGSRTSGVVSVNGVPIDPVAERQSFAYVMSEDHLDAFSTPEESIEFTVRLRQAHLKTSEDVKKRVEQVIDELGLEKCRHTLNGNELVKGISSGERKRTSIGIEMVSDPQILFLDEPTSGLDSYTAFQIVLLLKRLAQTGRCVVATIHQPASETFALFDEVLFLSKGAVAYHGPVSELKSYLSSAGYVCPDKHNPCDFMMALVQQPESSTQLVEAWRPRMQKTQELVVERRRGSRVEGHMDHLKIVKSHTKTQLAQLMKREGNHIKRDKRFLVMRLMSPLFMTTVIGAVLFNEGLEPPTSQSHVTAVTFIAINSMMSVAQPLILTFPYERPVFIREYSAGHYDVFPYFVSKVLWEIPVSVVQVLIIVTVAYFMTNLQGNFGIILSAALLNSAAASALIICIGAAATDPRKALELMPLVIMPQFLFAGLWVRISTIPAVLRWIQYIVPMKYAVSILYYGEFRDLQDGDKIMAENNIEEDLLWLYYLVIVALIVAARCLGLLVLKLSARKTVF